MKELDNREETAEKMRGSGVLGCQEASYPLVTCCILVVNRRIASLLIGLILCQLGVLYLMNQYIV